MSTPTFYWHDYETFGINPAVDRPSQFAGIRTDLDLNPIGDPLVLFCKPAPDRLPNPEACLVTGITPQAAYQKGVSEADFIRQIHTELAYAQTCTVGYNNLHFDDEVTRYTLYRNFYDPYAREYQNGNSRWDIIDLVRMCYALRPEGIEWPRYEDGRPSFRLEELSKANNLKHESAHDALSDVYATIALAKLVKTKQNKLFNYALSLKQKQNALNLLNVRDMQPIVHTSSKFPSETGCTSVVAPVALHPTNKNGVVVYNLRHDPSDLINATANEIRERLFTRTEDLPEGVERIHLKTVHVNKSPMLAPLNTLTERATERLQLDMAVIEKHIAQLKKVNGLSQKIRNALHDHQYENSTDPELMLYTGFLGEADRQRCLQIQQATPEQLADLSFAFDDKRLPELLFRYRARN